MTAPAQLLTAGQVARICGVHRKTVTRWADEGKLTYVRTPGGHRRFSSAQPAIADALAYRSGRQP